jgi:NADP-dependent 3-hydroxy acid dehydrogenase YdfG
MNNQQKVWFITGASSDFGRAYAEHALEQGHNLAVTARTASKLAEIVKLNPERVLAVTMDVNNPIQVQNAVKETLDRFGRV